MVVRLEEDGDILAQIIPTDMAAIYDKPNSTRIRKYGVESEAMFKRAKKAREDAKRLIRALLKSGSVSGRGEHRASPSRTGFAVAISRNQWRSGSPNFVTNELECLVAFGPDAFPTICNVLVSADDLRRERMREKNSLLAHIQLYGGGDRERDILSSRWRAARLDRFKARQQRERQWISFAEIAEWCSKEEGSILPNLEKSQAAYQTLASDLLAGEFDEDGRSRVLFLHPSVTKSRMTTAWLRDAITKDYGGDHGRSGYLSNCWLRRDMFSRWLAKHRLQESPARFQPGVQLKKAKRGRPAEYNWAGVKSKLSQYVSKDGPVQTFDELLQKCSDFACELHPDRKTPDDSTIRKAIRKYELNIAAKIPGN